MQVPGVAHSTVLHAGGNVSAKTTTGSGALHGPSGEVPARIPPPFPSSANNIMHDYNIFVLFRDLAREYVGRKIRL